MTPNADFFPLVIFSSPSFAWQPGQWRPPARLLGLFHEAMHHADPAVLNEKQNARDAITGQGATHFP
jgi:hypothetical protein